MTIKYIVAIALQPSTSLLPKFNSSGFENKKVKKDKGKEVPSNRRANV